MARGRFAAWFVALALCVSSILFGAAPAMAASDNTYDRFDIAYVVDASGKTRVTETITLRFGSSAGRHGLKRTLVTREQLDANNDHTMPVSNVSVTSPDSGVSTEKQVTTQTSGRHEQTTIQIGSSSSTISAPTATYVISYDQTGLLMPGTDYDQFYVDAVGPGLGTVQSSTVSVTVPGGVQKQECFAGPVKSTTACTSSTVDSSGKGIFKQAPLTGGDIFTVHAGITRGLVDATISKTPAASSSSSGSGSSGGSSSSSDDGVFGTTAKAGLFGLIVTALGSIGMVVSGRKRKDERFIGVPPGSFPPPGTNPQVGNDDVTEIPVRFTPPDLPVADAGYLLDGGHEVRHMTATMVGLATSGAMTLQAAHDGQPSLAIPKDTSRVPDAPSQVVFEGLFGPTPSGPVVVDEKGSLTSVFTALQYAVDKDAERGQWFKRVRGKGARIGFSGGVVFLLFIAFANPLFVPLIAFAAPLIILPMVHRSVSRRDKGQRSATGRALLDQVEGFKTYIATAEADQLRFEEGQDIFSRYLPWAILFDEAKRWTEVCEKAVGMGLMATPDTAWYGGGAWDPTWVLWNLDTFDSSMSSSAVPEPSFDSSSFSGSDFGSSSSFDSGGFSGGGFGGGGADSW